jgi:hypothetical protein
MSQTDAPQTSVAQPAEPKRGAPIRLIVLLGILAVVLGAFLVDLFYMFDAVNTATVRLQAAADEMAERPRKDGKAQFLTKEGVAAAIGFAPTTSKVEGGRLVEHYRWWGALPLERRFIMVEYEDEAGTAYKGYEISNRDIFGNDVDPEAVNLNSDSPPSDPANSSPPPDAPPPGNGQTPPEREDSHPPTDSPPPAESSPEESDTPDKSAESDPNET